MLKKNGKYVLSDEDVIMEKIKMAKNCVYDFETLNEQIRKKNILLG